MTTVQLVGDETRSAEPKGSLFRKLFTRKTRPSVKETTGFQVLFGDSEPSPAPEPPPPPLAKPEPASIPDDDARQLISDFRQALGADRSPAAIRQAALTMLQSGFSLTGDWQTWFDRQIDISGSVEAEPQLYGRNIAAVAESLGLKPAKPAGSAVNLHLGKDSDFIASQPGWTPERVLNAALMSALQPTSGTAIVTSIRNEGLSILEWLAHHKALGFERFFVYTNDNSDESDRLLDLLHAAGELTLIRNEVAEGTKVQRKVMVHAVELLPELRNYAWAFFIDVDEFFMSRCEPELDLGSVLRRVAAMETEPACICFNWKWFGSENAYGLTDGLLLERFQHSIHNTHVKSFVRPAALFSMTGVHAPSLLAGEMTVNSELQEIEPVIHQPATYGVGQLNHYWNKSFQEFALKRARGRISAGVGAPLLGFESFFEWGANGRRGNYDPPIERVRARLEESLEHLLTIPGVAEEYDTVKRATAKAIAALEAEQSLADVYEHFTGSRPDALPN